MYDALSFGTQAELEEHIDAYNWLEQYVAATGSFPKAELFFKKIAAAHLKQDPNYYDSEMAETLQYEANRAKRMKERQESAEEEAARIDEERREEDEYRKRMTYILYANKE